MSTATPVPPPSLHIRAVDLSASLATQERLSVLSADEHRRLNRYRLPQPAYEFGLTRAALRHITGRYLRQHPAAVPLETGCPHCQYPHGRPRVPDLALSVSHTRGKALIAVATKPTPLGIDIEAHPPGLPHASPSRRKRWTQAEAYAKACDPMPAMSQIGLHPLNRASATGHPTLCLMDLELPDDPFRNWTAALATTQRCAPPIIPWSWGLRDCQTNGVTPIVEEAPSERSEREQDLP